MEKAVGAVYIQFPHISKKKKKKKKQSTILLEYQKLQLC